jgi:hypothetical protein
VLSHKTRHQIATDAGVIDEIVGPKTMAKLDQEIREFDSIPGPCLPDSDRPQIELGDADEPTVNFALTRLGVVPVISADALGGMRIFDDGTSVATEALGANRAGQRVPSRAGA